MGGTKAWMQISRVTEINNLKEKQKSETERSNVQGQRLKREQY